MTHIRRPIYRSLNFWSVLIALTALLLTQLPPVKLWLVPAHLEVEVYSRMRIAHKVGNPNVGMVLTLRNTGGTDLRILSMEAKVFRDSMPVATLPILTYETAVPATQLLFTPFDLKLNESWTHTSNFVQPFDRATDKLYRKNESALRKEIEQKKEIASTKKAQPAEASAESIQPFLDLFDELFIWQPGEYSVKLGIETVPASASFQKTYNFTLYESDSEDLRTEIEDYPNGNGLFNMTQRNLGIYIPLSRFSTP